MPGSNKRALIFEEMAPVFRHIQYQWQQLAWSEIAFLMQDSSKLWRRNGRQWGLAVYFGNCAVFIRNGSWSHRSLRQSWGFCATMTEHLSTIHGVLTMQKVGRWEEGNYSPTQSLTVTELRACLSSMLHFTSALFQNF